MSKEKTICPLTYSTGKGAYDQEVSNFDYCVEEKCAWWDKESEECTVLVIGNSLKYLPATFREIIGTLTKGGKL